MNEATVKKKRRKPVNLTARAMKELREMGFVAEKVEQRLPHCFITKDFIGCVDVIAFREGVGILGIQVTSGGSGGHHSHRWDKSVAEPRLRRWLLCGGRFEIWSYDRPRGGKRKTWTLRREEIRLDDLPPEPPVASASPVTPLPQLAHAGPLFEREAV